jgi:hypothetical protein
MKHLWFPRSAQGSIDSMMIEDNTKPEETNDEIINASDFVQWNAFFWKLIRSLAIIVAATTAIFFICKWLIY